MTHVRRRVLRPTNLVAAVETRRIRTTQRQREQLEANREALARWMSKLKRAFHAIERLQAQSSRLERQLKS